MVKRKQRKSEKVDVEVSSGNVFEDFGYPNPEEMDAKSDLAILIAAIIKQKKLTQGKAAKLMGIDQPKISKIIRGILSEFTIERLMKYVLSLGFDIELKPIPHKAKTTSPSIHVVNSKNIRKSARA